MGGILAPDRGHSDPDSHSAGDNYSIFTSWTSDKKVAERFSQGRGFAPENGVILTKTFKRSEVIKTSDGMEKLLQEREYLVPGVVVGAKVENNGVPPEATTHN